MKDCFATAVTESRNAFAKKSGRAVTNEAAIDFIKTENTSGFAKQAVNREPSMNRTENKSATFLPLHYSMPGLAGACLLLTDEFGTVWPTQCGVEKCSCGMGEKLSSNYLLLTTETNCTGRFVIYIFPLTEIAQQMLHGNGPIKRPHLWEWFFGKDDGFFSGHRRFIGA
ncbi:hypothetical protein T10_6893 [Trichinella papuae]|uniref:Uncharacterized protein n=1 Tax=Trichinella papuae TaxID=268474 RepID=A0A0V1M9G5_9BILA|nr:hypothetical protein T10_6893 [Trichinella papuae]